MSAKASTIVVISGAAMIAALHIAERIDHGNIVVIFPDRAEKYLSTTMFADLAED